MRKYTVSEKRASEAGKYNIRAIERAMQVLNLFSRDRNKLTLDEITRETGLSKPTVFRILSTLECHKYVILDVEDGRYRLGAIFLSLGSAVLASMSLRRVAGPHLVRLRESLHITVLMGAMVDNSLVYIDRKESPGPVRIASDIGWRRDPPHYGMLGMVLLAYREDEEILQLLDEYPLNAYTKNSLTTPEQWLQRVREIREAGYVVEFEEAIEGVWGVAAPVRDSTGDVVAAVGVAQPMTAKTGALVSENIRKVCACAEAISDELGYRPAAPFYAQSV